MHSGEKRKLDLVKHRLVEKILSWSKTLPNIDSILLKERSTIATIVLKRDGSPDIMIDIDISKKQMTFYTCELTNYPLTREIVPTKSPEISWLLSELLELQSRTRIAKIILLREEDAHESPDKKNHRLLRMHLSATIMINGLTRQTFTTLVKEHFWLASQIATRIEEHQLPQSWRTIERDYKRKFDVPNF